MGTERSVEFRGECSCRHGSYEIDECTPDHGWPTSNQLWYESRINCSRCDALYEIERRGKNFVLVERSSKEQLEALGRESFGRGKSLMATPDVQSALRALELLLASQPSVAAVWRVLKAAGLTNRSEATFRNRWNGPRAWSQLNIQTSNLRKVFSLVKMESPEVMQELAEISKLFAASNQAVEPFGPTIYQLP